MRYNALCMRSTKHVQSGYSDEEILLLRTWQFGLAMLERT